jgi:hypothetical protein
MSKKIRPNDAVAQLRALSQAVMFMNALPDLILGALPKFHNLIKPRKPDPSKSVEGLISQKSGHGTTTSIIPVSQLTFRGVNRCNLVTAPDKVTPVK